MTEVLTIAPDDPLDPGATALLDASQALMRRLYSPDQNHFLSLEALRAPDVRFLTARLGDRTLGCCAVKLRDGYGEIKSFYVDEAARGHGVGQKLIEAIEDLARAEAVPVLNLETGDLLDAACRLYARMGYTRCPPFGDYEENGASVFMTKTL